MTFIRSFMLVILLLAGAVVTFAQSELTGKSTAPSVTTVTVSISAKGVRFTAPGSVGQLRLEVFNANGDSLYNSEFKAGNIQDWALKDSFGQILPDGSYMCVITVRDVSGKLGMKQGAVLVQGGQASLKLAEVDQTGAIQPEKALTPVADGNGTAVALLAHDGQQGRVVSGRGGLSFSVGDFFAGKDVEHMRLTAKGDLGVGVENPQAKLDVAGQIRASEGIIFPDGSVQITAANAYPTRQRSGQILKADELGRPVSLKDNSILNISGVGSTNRLTKWADGPNGVVGDSTLTEVGGNIGIGITNPTTGLDYRHTLAPFLTRDIGATNFGTPQSAIQIGVTNTGSRNIGVGPSFLFFSDDSAGQKEFLGRLSAGWENPTDGQEAGFVSFNVRANSADTGALTERMRITAAGKVGIGTTNPQSTLDVAGDINVSGNAVIAGNIAAKYQDVAEWVPTSEQLTAGTVVSLDTTRNNTVAASARAYDTHIAGVISPQPGVILGEGGEGKALVATTGRVKVKVDASRGAIRIGDLLVSSEKPGMAMKSRPIKIGEARIHRPGTIIGKALEPLAKGQGEILVLLSLQ